MDLTATETFVLLAKPRPLPTQKLSGEEWADAASRLAASEDGRLRIELALSDSCCMIQHSDAVIDEGRMVGRDGPPLK